MRDEPESVAKNITSVVVCENTIMPLSAAPFTSLVIQNHLLNKVFRLKCSYLCASPVITKHANKNRNRSRQTVGCKHSASSCATGSTMRCMSATLTILYLALIFSLVRGPDTLLGCSVISVTKDEFLWDRGNS